MTNEQPKKDTKVNVSVEQVNESIKGGFVIDEFVGIKAKITDIEVHEHEQNGMYLRVYSNVLGFFKKEDNTEVEIRASENFSLVKTIDENNKSVLNWVENGKLGKFLQLKKVSHPKDLIGKDILTIKILKGQKEVLSFN